MMRMYKLYFGVVLAGLVSIMSIGSNSAYGDQDLPEGKELVAVYHFDEGSGLAAKDGSGNNNHGTIHNAAWAKSGKFGSALYFDRKDSYVEIPKSDVLEKVFQSEGTLEMWIHPTTDWNDGKNHFLFFTRQEPTDAHGNHWWLYKSWGEYNELTYRGGGAGHSLKMSWDTRWYFLTLTWKGIGSSEAQIGLYVDGKGVLRKKKGTFIPKIGDIFIGSRKKSGEEACEGIIDEVKIYNRALSAEEIKEHYLSAPESFTLVSKPPKNLLLSKKAERGGENPEQSFPLEYKFHPANSGRGDKIYLVKASANVIYLCLARCGMFKRAVLALDLPLKIALKGAFRMGRDQPPVKVTQETIIIKNKEYLRHYIYFPSTGIPSIDSGYAFCEYIALFLNAEKCEEEKINIYSHLVCDDMDGKEKKIEAFILPKLEERKKPKRFKIWVHRDWPLRSIWGNKELWDALTDTYRKMGISAVIGDTRDKKFIERLHQSGLKYIDFPDSGKTFCGWQNEPKCTTSFINREGPGFSDIINESISCLLKGADGVAYNIEPRSNSFCYCQKCLEAFSKYSKIPLEGLNKDVIIFKYKKEWVEFKGFQVTECIRLVGEAMKEVNPEKIYLLVTGDGITSEDKVAFVWRMGGSDPRLFDKHVDFHGPMFYGDSRRVYKLMEQMAPFLKKPVVPYIDVGYWAANPHCSPPKEIGLDMFSTATSGGGGVMLYLISSLDGEYIKEIEKAAYEIALLENYFYKGERKDGFFEIEGLPYSELYLDVGGRKILMKTPSWKGSLYSKVHLLKGKYLLSMFNLDLNKRDAYVSVKSAAGLKEGKYMLYDPISEILITPSGERRYWRSEELKSGITYFLPADEVRFLVIARYNEESKFKETILESEIKQDYEKRRSEKIEKPDEEISKGSFRIDWEDVDGDKKHEVSLESKVQKLWIKCEDGGKLWSWRIKETGDDLVFSNFASFDTGGGFSDQFWQKPCPWGDKYLRDKPYEIISRRIEGQRAIVELGRKVKDKLAITKTYSISSDKPVLSMEYSIKNLTLQPLNISFWLHNWFKLGGEKLNAKSLSNKDCVNLIFPTKEGISADKDKTSKSIVYSVENAPFTSGREDWEQKMRKGEFTEGWFGLYCPLSKEALIIKTNYSQLLQIYRWQGADTSTLEWMYKVSKIKPGEIWKTKFDIVYFKKVKLDEIKHLLGKN